MGRHKGLKIPHLHRYRGSTPLSGTKESTENTMGKVCGCEDSYGVKCKRVMTKKEYEQDGVCSFCADNVWEEITTNNKKGYLWSHKDNKN